MPSTSQQGAGGRSIVPLHDLDELELDTSDEEVDQVENAKRRRRNLVRTRSLQVIVTPPDDREVYLVPQAPQPEHVYAAILDMTPPQAKSTNPFSSSDSSLPSNVANKTKK